MNRKTICLLLFIAMCIILLCGCGAKEEPKAEPAVETAVPATQAPEAEPAETPLSDAQEPEAQEQEAPADKAQSEAEPAAAAVKGKKSTALIDPSGNEVYRIVLASWASNMVVTSSESGKAVIEYTNGGARPAEIHVNAYGSAEEFVNAISGKYWTVYTPQEDEMDGERFVYNSGFWDQKVNGSYEQYEDIFFYFELSDGNLVTGVYDASDPTFMYACFENGFSPVG